MENTETKSSTTKKEWKVIEPEKAKEYVIVNDGEENIYIGKNKEKAKKMCKAVNMHDELISFVKTMAFIYSSETNYPKGTIGATYREDANNFLKQAEQK